MMVYVCYEYDAAMQGYYPPKAVFSEQHCAVEYAKLHDLEWIQLELNGELE